MIRIGRKKLDSLIRLSNDLPLPHTYTRDPWPENQNRLAESRSPQLRMEENMYASPRYVHNCTILSRASSRKP